MWLGATVAAPAFTVVCAAGDNLAIRAAAARAPRGHALAAAFGDATEHGYWGEELTTGAGAAGIAALVIDGTVRDVAALKRHQFSVFAKGLALRLASKGGPGLTGAAVGIGDCIVNTGDRIVTDADRIVAITLESLAAVLASGL